MIRYDIVGYDILRDVKRYVMTKSNTIRYTTARYDTILFSVRLRCMGNLSCKHVYIVFLLFFLKKKNIYIYIFFYCLIEARSHGQHHATQETPLTLKTLFTSFKVLKT